MAHASQIMETHAEPLKAHLIRLRAGSPPLGQRSTRWEARDAFHRGWLELRKEIENPRLIHIHSNIAIAISVDVVRGPADRERSWLRLAHLFCPRPILVVPSSVRIGLAVRILDTDVVG